MKGLSLYKTKIIYPKYKNKKLSNYHFKYLILKTEIYFLVDIYADCLVDYNILQHKKVTRLTQSKIIQNIFISCYQKRGIFSGIGI